MQATTKRLAILTGVLGSIFAYSANAAVIHWNAQEIPIPTTFAGVSLNLETADTTNDIAGMPGADANFFAGGIGISNDADQTSMMASWQPVRSGIGNTDAIVNLTPGTLVDGSSVTGDDFGASGGAVTHFATFTSGTPGYIGYSVVLSDNTTAYGWMRVTLRNDNMEGVIHEWAYENSGAPIEVGAIPEPSLTLLASIGLAALTLRRKR